jgi:hypothetical protein
LPTVELRRADRRKPESRRLNEAARDVTSQFGEDGILAAIFDAIGRRSRWCVEFGAWDGEHLSNTWDLIHNQGWSAVLIEGNPDRARALAETVSARDDVAVREAYVSWHGENSLDALLAPTALPREFDLLSVDIDGNDWHVWREFNGYRPRVVVIEFNPTAPNELYFVQDADPAINQGASLLAMIELGRFKGYELAAVTFTNAIFVLAEEFPVLGIEDNSIDALHAPQIDMAVCHGYDGTFFAAGHVFAAWHGIPLSHEDIQPLPRALRTYPDPG